MLARSDGIYWQCLRVGRTAGAANLIKCLPQVRFGDNGDPDPKSAHNFKVAHKQFCSNFPKHRNLINAFRWLHNITFIYCFNK